MNIKAPVPTGHVRIELESAEALNVLHPKSIVAYQGAPQLREDRFLTWTRAYHKRKWIQSRLQGPSSFLLSLPAGCSLETVRLQEHSNLLFDFRHVMFFTEGLELHSKVQKIRNAWITREFVRMKFSGPGAVGVVTAGELASVELRRDVPLFVEAGALVAYPEDADIRLSVYGNQLASQHMSVQWQIRGTGPVLIQTGAADTVLADDLRKDGLVKRLLRELLPFGSVYIK
ncbi:AIM24 family protein [Paenibacillus gansuensis]|uniref:AIM24 family protein n=1 Tax=Paenibacillus gansuensis TaxID=306542 RepID=A0ABW5PH51_9BACL